MKKIVSYCLFGDNDKYTINCLVNLELCNRYYKDWFVYIYYDETVPDKIIKTIRLFPKVTLIQKKGYKYDRLWWRFLAYDEGDLFISRDADSHITEREVLAVEDWINSNKALHIMRDSVSHNRKILGGMFGIKKTYKINNMNALISDLICYPRNYQDDENWLSNKLYPLFVNDMVVHDSTNIFQPPDKTPECRSNLALGDHIGTSKNINDVIEDMYVKKYIHLTNRHIKIL